MNADLIHQDAEIRLKDVRLSGELIIPENAEAVVLFSHGSGSSRFSPRNKFVAEKLQENGLGTFLFDLLTAEEDVVQSKRFDIELITQRLAAVTDWFRESFGKSYSLGYFGASTGAASALCAAAMQGDQIKAVVSRGGRPDLAISVLSEVKAPTMLIVGGVDYYVIGYNDQAYQMLNTEKEMVVVKGASHLFEEPGALLQVANHAARWFSKHLVRKPAISI